MNQSLTAALPAAFHDAPVPGIVSAYLFGSHAIDRAHRQSDVDLAVLLDRTLHPTKRDRFEARVRLIGYLSHALHCHAVDLVVLDDASPHLVRRIMMDGRRVYCVDSAVDHAARRTALLRAADLEPFLRRMRQIKLNAIAR